MATLFDRFSSQENLRKAYQYVRSELATSTLSVSPFQHPGQKAVETLADEFFPALEKSLRSGTYKPQPGVFAYLPKDDLGLRPLCLLSIIDRIVYQAIFNQVVLGSMVDAQLSKRVCFANRVSEDPDSEYFIQPYPSGWDTFLNSQIQAFEQGYTWRAEFDVQRYYENIPIPTLLNKLDAEFGVKDEKILNILEQQLRTWAEYPTLMKGVPQGSSASAVIGNVYLSALDTFVESKILSTGAGVRFFRYNDDMVIMGRRRVDVVHAMSAIVLFLRKQNLNLNEKTKLKVLTSAEEIEQIRFYSGYAEGPQNVSQDALSRIADEAPFLVQLLLAGEKLERPQQHNLNYYLVAGSNYEPGFLGKLVTLISTRPSLTARIVQYISAGRRFHTRHGNREIVSSIDRVLWAAYTNGEVHEWSKFWILKLLASNKDASLPGLESEVQRIITAPVEPMFKLVGFYYRAIRRQSISAEHLRAAMRLSTTALEKSLYSFFFLYVGSALDRMETRHYVEGALDSDSHELNLIGCYLHRVHPDAGDVHFDGIFSKLLLAPEQADQTIAAIARAKGGKEGLANLDSASRFMGVDREKDNQVTVALELPENFEWQEVELKVKNGLQDLDIFYAGQHLVTTSYDELGFAANTKNKRTNTAWRFLIALSAVSTDNFKHATAEHLRSMIDPRKSISRDSVYQAKRALVVHLRNLFQTKDDPFHEDADYYHPRFTILPSPDLRHEELRRQGGRFNENRVSEDTEMVELN